MSEHQNELLSAFDPVRLGQNIRTYRILRELTQTELARRLFVAPQSVSKWERGETVPDLARLYALARELSVSLDTLMGTQPEGKTFIGIDGGGTKTEFVLVNERGELLNTIVLGPSNPNTCGLDSALRVVRQGIDFLRPRESNVCGIFFGGSGMGTGSYAKTIRTKLREAYPGTKVGCGTDILNVTACSTDSENCIAVICGTGSVVFAAAGDKLLRTGGGGYLLDRSGSGYHMGRSAIVAALEERDGTGPVTRLTGLVEEKLGGTVWDNITRLYKEDVSYIASFAPLVEIACAQNDPVACEIMKENADRLAKLIAVAREKAPEARVLVLAGSQFKKNETFLRQVTGQLDSDLKIELPDYPPVWGACLRSLKLCGVRELPTPERFLEGYNAQRKGEKTC